MRRAAAAIALVLLVVLVWSARRSAVAPTPVAAPAGAAIAPARTPVFDRSTPPAAQADAVPAATVADRPESAILGRVVAQGSGAPVAGVTVAALGFAPVALIQTVTTDDGAFELAALPAGTYDVVVAGDGWTGRRAQIAAPATAPVTDLVIEATRGVAVSGRVLGCAEPRVTLTSLTDRFTATGGTAVQFSAVPPGTYRVIVECAGRRPSTSRLDVGTTPITDATWRADPGLALAGIALDATGVPLPGARIAVEPRDRDAADRGVLDVLAGGDGRFVAAGLAPGHYEIAIVSEDLRTLGRPAAVTLVDRDADVVLSAAPAGALRGRIGGTTARIAMTIDEAGIVAATEIARDGTFAFSDLAPGVHRVVVCEPWAGEVATSTAAVTASRITDVVLVPRALGHAIQGRVVDDHGRAVDGAQVTAAAEPPPESPCAGDPAGRPPVTTDRDGRFRIAAMPDGPYALEATAQDGRHGEAHDTAVIELR